MIGAAAVETITSPEGIQLRFDRATAGERLVAITVDLVLMSLVMFVGGLVLWFVFGMGAALLASFLVRQGWFVWFETRWNGRTPGKRMVGLRVIRADGGPMTVETVLARNLTREVELFLPLAVVASPDVLFPDHTGLVRVLAALWILLLLFFPLTNPHRVRIGDLLAGTRVVVTPRFELARDLADAARSRTAPAAPPAEFQFSRAQLSIYGEHELSVLEDILRKVKKARGDEALIAVSDAICRRIGWDREAIADRHGAFLSAFYRAQRQHLEQQLLLGRRRLRKQPRHQLRPDRP